MKKVRILAGIAALAPASYANAAGGPNRFTYRTVWAAFTAAETSVTEAIAASVPGRPLP
jgi:hypothetical protein